MSDLEDDYLSDKFLTESATVATSKSLTYAERRRQAQREAERKNVQNRKKTKRELEEDALREGLSTSLFDKAKEEEKTVGTTNKAMAMMLKMGFKPGESLGRKEQEPSASTNVRESTETIITPLSRKTAGGHLTEPLSLDIWAGRQGVGKRKRPVSPKAAAKLAKLVQDAADAAAHGTFRERAREEYQERRAQGRLHAATQTCITLDEKAGNDFNVFWLNPNDPESFPPDLLEALIAQTGLLQAPGTSAVPDADRLRQQIRADALQPVEDLESDEKPTAEVKTVVWSEDTIEEARKFISTSATKRLELVLNHLRSEYCYCFWCGTQYKDAQDMAENCPGVTEEDHD